MAMKWRRLACPGQAPKGLSGACLPQAGVPEDAPERDAAHHAPRDVLGGAPDVPGQLELPRQRIAGARRQDRQRNGGTGQAVHDFVDGAVATGDDDEVAPGRDRLPGQLGGAPRTGGGNQLRAQSVDTQQRHGALQVALAPVA
jgi:hypothetical protein